MKLCIVTPKIVKGDGQGRANYEIAREALRRGYAVTVVTSQLDPTLQQNDQLTWINLSPSKLPSQLLKEIDIANRSATWLKTHRSAFDLVLTNGCVTWAAGDINAAHFVHSAWLHSPFHAAKTQRNLYGVYHGIYTRLNAHWETRAFQQAKTVIAVSNQVKQELIAIGIDPDRIRVISNGVDLDEFYPGAPDRSRLNLPTQVPLALFVGDIRLNRKNLDTVLHALTQVPTLHLAVVGNTEGSPYPALAKSLHLNDRVHFLGFRRDVAEVMRSADIFVLPSRYEPFGMVILEAMASGLPVVTAATTGAAEIVTPEAGMVLPDSEDVSALAQVLQQLIDHPRLRIQMGQTSRTIAERHSWSSKAWEYLNLCEQLSHPKHPLPKLPIKAL